MGSVMALDGKTLALAATGALMFGVAVSDAHGLPPCMALIRTI
jgi:hypothetical protein